MNVPISISSIGRDEVGRLYVTSFDDGVLYQLTERPDSTANGEGARENVALRGSGRASTHVDAIELATDGDPGTGWEAESPPPHWFSVLLDDLYLIDKVELVFPHDAGGRQHLSFGWATDPGPVLFSNVSTRSGPVTVAHWPSPLSRLR